MRDVKGIHNFIYLYGPGSEAASEAEYEERYPGDGYVDMVGFDSYDDSPNETENYTFQDNFKNTVRLTNSFAKKHNKLFAVTETGIKNPNDKALLLTGNGRKDWYNEILDIVTDEEFDCCYFMLWSNYSSSGSYYTPFVTKKNENGTFFGHEMLDNFISFYNDQRSIFASDQKSVISGLGSIKNPQTAGRELDGYIMAPISGNRILDVTKVQAQLNMVTDKEVLFTISGNGKNINLETKKDAAGKVYSAVITKENLDSIGETLQGKIGLYAGGSLLQEISVIFNIEEKSLSAEQIDDFETYGGLTGLLINKWSTNKDSGCTVDVSLVEEPCYEGSYALKFDYNETKNGWGGATISKEADWSQYNALRFWVKPDGKNQKTVIQINAGGGSYEAYLQTYPDYANSDKPLLVTLPFSEFTGKDGAGKLGGEALKSISGFGLWVNAIPGSDAFANGETMVSGTLYYDDIRAVSTDTKVPVFEPAETKPSEPEKPTTPTEKPATPTQKPAGTPVPTNQPQTSYPYIPSNPQGGTSQTPGGTQVPAASQVPGATQAPAASQAPGTTQVPAASQAPGATQAPAASQVPGSTQTPGTTTEIKKDDVTGTVTEITTTKDNNTTTVVEKTTLADGTENIRETVTEDSDGIIKIKETSSSNKANVVLVKNITKYTDGDIISMDAVLHTGKSEIGSDYSAQNTIPESFLNEAKEAGINLQLVF